MPGRIRTLLYVTPDVDLGGVSRTTLDWLETLDRSRFRAIVATTLPSENRALYAATEFADEVWALPDLMPGSEFPRFLLDLAATREVDVLHVGNARLGLLLLPDFAALPHRPRVVVQLHEAREDGLTRYAASRYNALIDAYSVVSPEIAALLARLHVAPGKVHEIRTGIDARGRFDPDRVEPRELGPGFHVLWPARISAQKDPLLMAAVVEELRTRVPESVVHVVGEGPLEGELRTALGGHDGGVELHGPAPADEMACWYRGADAVLLTSVYEGIPHSAAEALALRTPVVAPDIDGVRELAGAGMELVAPRDEPGGYAALLAALAGDPARRERLGREGRTRMLETFTREEAARRHAALYEELTA